MKTIKKTVLFTVSLFFAVLFSWDAVSKTVGFENFRKRLEQAPGYEGFGEPVAGIIIALQLLTVILLCFRESRWIGLWVTLGMLTVFTGYISYLLQYSENLPCTCLGFFEKVSWKGSLILNMGLMITAIGGIITAQKDRDKN